MTLARRARPADTPTARPAPAPGPLAAPDGLQRQRREVPVDDPLAPILARAVAERAAGDELAMLQRWPKWMKFWKKKQPTPVPVPVPVPLPIATGPVQYGATSIRIIPSATYVAPGGDNRDYVQTVTDALDDIQGHVGAGFFAALGANGKQQGIKYGGANSMQCSGSLHGYTKLRRAHDLGDSAEFGRELTLTLQTMNVTAQQLATALRAQGLPRWSNTVDPAPINDLGDANQTDVKVADWLAGTSIPSRDEMDVLMLVVQGSARPGVGANSRIDYDPQKTHTSNGPRPVQVALFHELCHAYYYSQGEQLGREDSLDEDNGGRLFELMAVGLPPFDTRAYSENALRTAWPFALRASYP